MLNFKEANKQLNNIPGIMEETLEYYGIKKARVKDKYECPFCGSKDNLHLYKDNYYCFGRCARKYYPVNIVMEKENIPYTEAIKLLAVRYGIEIPNIELTEEERIEFEKRKEEEKKKRKNIFKLEEAAKTSKDITRKFELSCLTDNIENTADLENKNIVENVKSNDKKELQKIKESKDKDHDTTFFDYNSINNLSLEALVELKANIEREYFLNPNTKESTTKDNTVKPKFNFYTVGSDESKEVKEEAKVLAKKA